MKRMRAWIGRLASRLRRLFRVTAGGDKAGTSSADRSRKPDKTRDQTSHPPAGLRPVRNQPAISSLAIKESEAIERDAHRGLKADRPPDTEGAPEGPENLDEPGRPIPERTTADHVASGTEFDTPTSPPVPGAAARPDTEMTATSRSSVPQARQLRRVAPGKRGGRPRGTDGLQTLSTDDLLPTSPMRLSVLLPEPGWADEVSVGFRDGSPRRVPVPRSERVLHYRLRNLGEDDAVRRADGPCHLLMSVRTGATEQGLSSSEQFG